MEIQLKKDCLYSHYYNTFEEFKFNIEQSLAEVNGKNKDAIKKLITTDFQVFDDIKDYYSAVWKIKGIFYTNTPIQTF